MENTIYQYRRKNSTEWVDITHEVWGALAVSKQDHEIRYITDGVAFYPEKKHAVIAEVKPVKQVFFDRAMSINYRAGLMHGGIIGTISTMILIGIIRMLI